MRFPAPVLALLALSLAACATPVGVSRVGLRDAYREVNRTALSERAATRSASSVVWASRISMTGIRRPPSRLRHLELLGDPGARD